MKSKGSDADESIKGNISPEGGEVVSDRAFTLNGMFAPRLGFIYDPTSEGKAKIFGHWGRFYESLPMDINARSFAGEVSYRRVFSGGECGAAVDGYGGPSAVNCPDDDRSGTAIGINGTLVAPGIKPQFMDERIFGIEYELMEDLKIGVAYQNRQLGRVIEDVSTDGAQTYLIANPGEWSEEEEAKLQARSVRPLDPWERYRAAKEAGGTERAAVRFAIPLRAATT